jgi:hypothetical protein
LQLEEKGTPLSLIRLARISCVFKALSLPGKFAIKDSDKFRLVYELSKNLGKQDMKLRKYIRNYVDG